MLSARISRYLRGTTAGEAIAWAVERHAELAPLVKHLRPAINLAFGEATQVLHDGDEARTPKIPPVAGRKGRVAAVSARLRSVSKK